MSNDFLRYLQFPSPLRIDAKRNGWGENMATSLLRKEEREVAASALSIHLVEAPRFKMKLQGQQMLTCRAV